MGLYGSPDTGNLYTKKETKKTKEKGYKPQKNIWVWIAIIIANILVLLMVGVTIGDVLTLLVLDSVVLLGISIVSLIVNLIERRKVGNDIRLIGISIIAFFIFAIILGTLS